MGLPVTVYRSEDAGAPQLGTRTPSEIIAILRACLVDGYGTKAAAGWSVAFEDAGTYKIAFRNSTVNGAGGYVQVWSNTGANTTAASTLYKAANGMTGLDTFINAGYTEVLHGTNTDTGRWMIIATSVSFYLFFMKPTPVGNTGGYYSVFIGEFESFIANDASRFVGSAGQTSDRTSDTSITLTTQSLFAANLQFKPRLYEADGGTSVVLGGISSLFPGILSTNITTENDVDAGVTLNFSVVPIVGSLATDSLSNKSQVSLLQPFIRGKLPGLMEGSFVGYTAEAFPYIREFFGQQYMFCPINVSIGNQGLKYWLNIEEWY